MERTIQKALRYLFLSLFFLLALLCALLQTEWVKKQIKQKLLTYCQEKGISLSIEEIEGFLPLYWRLEKVYLQLSPSTSFFAEDVSIRFAVMPLFAKNLSLAKMTVNKAVYTYEELPSFAFCSQKEAALSSWIKGIEAASLPFVFSVERLLIPELQIRSNLTQKTCSCSLFARGNYQSLSHLSLDLKITPHTLPACLPFLSASEKEKLETLRPKGSITFSLWGRKESFSFFTRANLTLFLSESPSPLFVESSLYGPWKSWRASLTSSMEKDLLPLQGHIRASINNLALPSYPPLKKGSLETFFSYLPVEGVQVEKCSLASDLFSLEAKGTLPSLHKIPQGSLAFCVPDIAALNLPSLPPLAGNLEGNVYYDNKRSHIALTSEELLLHKQSLGKLQFVMEGEKKETHDWQGEASLALEKGAFPLQGDCTFTWTPLQALHLNHFLLKIGEGNTQGDLTFYLPHKALSGKLFTHIPTLSIFQSLFPQVYLQGSLGIKTSFTYNPRSSKEQAFQGELITNEFQIDHLHAKELSLLLEGTGNPFSSSPCQGKLLFEGEHLSYPSLTQAGISLEGLSFQVQQEETKTSFIASGKGEWEHPFFFHTSGYLDSLSPKMNAGVQTRSISVTQVEGSLFQEPFHLLQPFVISKEEKKLKVQDLVLQWGQGNGLFNLEAAPSSAKVVFKAEKFPLHPLQLISPRLFLAGKGDIDLDLQAESSSLEGHIHLALEENEIIAAGQKTALWLKGLAQMELSCDTLRYTIDLKKGKEPFFSTKTSLPYIYSHYPFSFTLAKDKPLFSTMRIAAHAEELSALVNLGSQHLTGHLEGDFKLENTLTSPHLEGTLTWKQGSYANYSTGTQLENIDLLLQAEGNQVYLKNLTAFDTQSGKCQGSGTLSLDPASHFPYLFQAELTRLSCFQGENFQGHVSGKVELVGDSTQAKAQGALSMSSTKLSIPDTLPPDLPTLPVTYVNFPPQKQQKEFSSSPFPLLLNLELKTEEVIRIRGRGLNTEWQGALHLKGDSRDLKTVGSLSLSKGEFVFAGRVFTLSEGEISFQKHLLEDAYLSLRGNLSLSDLNITVLVKGPLSSPELTFQSIPYLPSSALLSRILFNKDISEISPMQALQLANTVMTLSGGAAPDVLETIRKSLGIDRLNLVSANNGSDAVSLQIGKYIAPGVMITLSQGADNSRVLIEIELKDGFFFEVETQQEEESKLSLKWHHSY